MQNEIIETYLTAAEIKATLPKVDPNRMIRVGFSGEIPNDPKPPKPNWFLTLLNTVLDRFINRPKK